MKPYLIILILLILAALLATADHFFDIFPVGYGEVDLKEVTIR